MEIVSGCKVDTQNKLGIITVLCNEVGDSTWPHAFLDLNTDLPDPTPVRIQLLCPRLASVAVLQVVLPPRHIPGTVTAAPCYQAALPKWCTPLPDAENLASAHPPSSPRVQLLQAH